MATNEINGSLFCWMGGQIPEPTPTTFAPIRPWPGVDGFAIRVFSEKGKPFEIQTIHDVLNLEAGAKEIEAWQSQLPIEELTSFWWNGVRLAPSDASVGVKYAVIDVSRVRLQSTGQWCGWVRQANSSALLHLRWTMRAHRRT